jgi:DNA-binding NtrC family response regulator
VTARLLIVDDVVANGRLLEASLTANYYVVKYISDSRAVQATVESWEPDVILLDIMMPHMDGYQVCKLLKSQPATAHIPVIMTGTRRWPSAPMNSWSNPWKARSCWPGCAASSALNSCWTNGAPAAIPPLPLG